MNTPDKIIKKIPSTPPQEDYLQACRSTKERRDSDCAVFSVETYRFQTSKEQLTRETVSGTIHSLTHLHLQGSLGSASSDSGSQTPQQYHLGR